MKIILSLIPTNLLKWPIYASSSRYLRVVVTLKNSEGASGQYTMEFASFGMNTMDESLYGREYSSFRSATLVPQKNKDFCKPGDVIFQIDSAMARINGQGKDLLATGIIKPYVQYVG
ncbi:MAG: hypothetical protein ACR5LF_01510 [Symbiopectobacterium sp.]